MSITIPDAVVAAMESEGAVYVEWDRDAWGAGVWGDGLNYAFATGPTPQAALDALAAKLEARGD